MRVCVCVCVCVNNTSYHNSRKVIKSCIKKIAQSSWTVEYANNTSSEWVFMLWREIDSDGEATGPGALGNMEYS